MSDFVNQVARVLLEVKNHWNSIPGCNIPGKITRSDCDSMVNEAISVVAARLKIERSTVADKCTRRMGLTMEGFKSLVYAARRGDQEPLINRVVAYRTTKDSPVAVRNIIKHSV